MDAQMDTRVIKVVIKSVWGNEMIYPACATSAFFAALVHQKTLTWKDVQIIKKLGYRVEVVTDKQTL